MVKQYQPKIENAAHFWGVVSGAADLGFSRVELPMDILPEMGDEFSVAVVPEIVTGGEMAFVPSLVAAPFVAPEDHATSVYLGRLAPGSRRAMRGALETIAEIVSGGALDANSLPWGELRYQHTAAVRSILAERYSAAMANKCLSALRGVLKEAWRLEQIETTDYQRAVDIGPVKGSREPKGRMLTKGELQAIFIVCANENGASGARDAAIVAVLAGAGLRRAEVVGLDRADYNPKTGAIHVRAGKGNKERGTFAGPAMEPLDAYLEYRGDADGPLFLPLKRGRPKKDGESAGRGRPLETGAGKMRRLNDQSIMDIVVKRCDEAGIDYGSPHDFRRTFASNALDRGGDISTVQKMMGHASPQTTARYDRRGDETKRRTAELVELPYVRPAKQKRLPFAKRGRSPF